MWASKLDVEPTVSLDGEVAIKVALEVSSIISQVSTQVPAVGLPTELAPRTGRKPCCA